MSYGSELQVPREAMLLFPFPFLSRKRLKFTFFVSQIESKFLESFIFTCMTNQWTRYQAGEYRYRAKGNKNSAFRVEEQTKEALDWESGKEKWRRLCSENGKEMQQRLYCEKCEVKATATAQRATRMASSHMCTSYWDVMKILALYNCDTTVATTRCRGEQSGVYQ